MAAGLLLLGLPRTTTGTWIDAFFWLSFSAFVVVFPAVLYRVHAHPTLLEDHHQLQYPLLAAPAAVLLIAWIALGGHQVGWYKSTNTDAAAGTKARILTQQKHEY